MRLVPHVAVSLVVLACAVGCLPPPPDKSHGTMIDSDGGSEEAGPAASDGGSTPADGAAVDLAGAADLAGANDLAQASSGTLVPARGGSSAGSGGGATGGVASRTTATGGVRYLLIVPATYADGQKAPLLVVYSGTEGAQAMASNVVALEQVAPAFAGYIRVVLDGVTYDGNGQAGATVMDEVRAEYDVDNDRTYLLGESAGTTAAFALGFHLRQSYFAAYWANDVSAASADAPAQTAAQLGFAPWGQIGPGGALALANALAANIEAAGYHTDATTPYAGSGSTTHGSPDQLVAAAQWLAGKSR